MRNGWATGRSTTEERVIDMKPHAPPQPALARGDDQDMAVRWRREVFADDLRGRAATAPDAPVYVGHRRGETVTVTFGELAGRVERLAAALQARDVGRGRAVVFRLPNEWETAALWLACGRVGAVAAAVPPWFGRRELDLVLGAVTPALLVTEDGKPCSGRTARDLPAEPVALGGLLAEAAAGARPVEPMPPVHADEVCQLAFTSGTTGRPRAVVHTFNTRYAALCAAVRQIPPGVATAAIADLTHTVGLMFNTLAPLATGRPSVFSADDAPETWLGLLAAQRVGCLVSTPPVLRDLVAAAARGGHAFPDLRQVVSLGAPIPPRLAGRLRAVLAPRLVNAFGTTETGMLAATSPGEDVAEETLGRPIEGVRIRLRPRDAGPSGDGGHLQVRTPGLCRRVIDLRTREEVWSAEAGDGWYDTGDLVERDAQGRLRHLGRASGRVGGDSMIPVAEVEDELLEHPAVADAAIVAVDDAQGHEVACAVIVADGTAPSLDDLRVHLRARGMTEVYLPERVAVMAGLPRTALGKLHRSEIQRRVTGGSVPRESRAFPPPRAIDAADAERVEAMARFLAGHTTAEALRAVLPPGTRHTAVDDVLARDLELDHGALLLFPTAVDAAVAELAARGMTVSDPIPSTVVRDRLAARYGRPPQDLAVTIVQAAPAEDAHRSLELFLLPTGPGDDAIRADEQAGRHEAHLAFRVAAPAGHRLDAVYAALAGAAGLTADGGGFNPHHGRTGRTVLYFRGPGRLPRPFAWPRRLEIIAEGHHPDLLRRHLGEPEVRRGEGS
ncbi:class I adenylate-forming enzyme family protein [Actinomadura harenae]|uniref:Uncharacterized protein n=1 Tax=Actinomadura harenae TaxID=2483351 RepID=A0A3M2M8T3_9ACTN|nr:AMP-binding protein [Actinomadura harenae]RMI45902.1 hypothetical protein EBO15_08270 [Actinomadura harenae]